MFVALNTAGERVFLESHAQAASFKGQDFVCPACRQPVRIKNGDVVIAHFAHIGPPCEFDSEGETATHLQGKMWLRQLGLRLGYQVELEVFYPEIKQRADVVWHTTQRTIVIEFQCSDLSSRKLMTRTAGYHRLGLDCIWVLGPRHHAKVIGARQERFLQRGVDGHLHLWFADGKSWLEDWQWHPEHYQITHYTMQQTVTRAVGLVQSRARFAQQLGNGLHFQTPQVMALADTAYTAGHALGGVPWLVSDDLSHVPGLPLPEWQLRTYWLLTFEKQAISREKSAHFFAQYATVMRTPLVTNAKLVAYAEATWETLLTAQGYLRATADGWVWQQALTWYPDLETKITAIKNSARQGEH